MNINAKKRTQSQEDNLRKPLFDLNKTDILPLQNLNLRRKTSEVKQYDFIIKTPINGDMHGENSQPSPQTLMQNAGQSLNVQTVRSKISSSIPPEIISLE